MLHSTAAAEAPILKYGHLPQDRNEARRHRLQGEAIGERWGEQRGEKRMKTHKDLSFVQALIKAGDYDDQKIASLVGVEESFVRKQRRLLSHG